MQIIIAILLFVLGLGWGAYKEDEHYNFVILAHRPPSEVYQRWKPLEDYLNQQGLPKRVKIVPAVVMEVEAMIHDGKADFLIIPPQLYIKIIRTQPHAVLPYPTLTVMERNGDIPLSRFGGVLFTKSDRKDINDLKDLKGKKVGTTLKVSLAYQSVAYEFKLLGIDLEKYAKVLELKPPQDRVVEAVLSGEVDAGIIRSAVLEDMARKGKIRLSQVKVLKTPGAPPESSFPHLVSTRLYPEWAFVVTKRVDEQTAKRVTVLLLSLDKDSEVLKSIGIGGFTLPESYVEVENLMKALGVEPFTPAEITWKAVFTRYSFHFVTSLSVLLGIILFLTSRSMIYYKRYHQELKRVEEIAENITGVFMQVLQKPDGTFELLYASKGFYAMFGVDVEEAKRDFNTLLSRIHPEDLPKLIKDMENSVKEGGFRHTVYRVLSPKYAWIYVECNASARRLHDGSCVWHAYTQDITEKYYIDKALSFVATGLYEPDYERRFYLACEWIGKTLDFEYVFVAKVSGESKASIISGWSKHGSFEPFDYHIEGTPSWITVKSHKNILPERVTSLYPEDGVLIKMGVESYAGRAIVTEEGKVVGILVGMGEKPIRDVNIVDKVLSIFADVLAVDFVRIENEERDRLLMTAFHSSSEGIVITDEEGRVLAVNPSYEDITGYTSEEVKGTVCKFLQKGWDKASYEEMQRTLRGKGHWEGEVLDRRKSGEVYVAGVVVDAIYDKKGRVTNYLVMIRDVSHYLRKIEELERIAYLDPLTKVYSRLFLNEALKQAVARARRDKSYVAVAYLDLDQFKPVNDTYGHALGDEVLIRVCERMRDIMRDTDYIVRVGGDEFVLIMMDLKLPYDVEPVLARLLEVVSIPVYLSNGAEVKVSASIGAVVFTPTNHVDTKAIVDLADKLMYKVKLMGGGNYTVLYGLGESSENSRQMG